MCTHSSDFYITYKIIPFLSEFPSLYISTILDISLLAISSILLNPTLFCKLHILKAAHSTNGKHQCESGSQEELKSHHFLSCALALAALVSQHSWIGVVMGQSQQHSAVGGTRHVGIVAVARQQVLKCLQSSQEMGPEAAVAAAGPSEESLRVPVVPIPTMLLRPEGLQ